MGMIYARSALMKEGLKMFNYDMEAIGIAKAEDHELIFECDNKDQDKSAKYIDALDKINAWPKWKKKIYKRDFLPSADEAINALRNIPNWLWPDEEDYK